MRNYENPELGAQHVLHGKADHPRQQAGMRDNCGFRAMIVH
jgi:hypothetical protein